MPVADPEMQFRELFLDQCRDIVHSHGEFWRFRHGQWRELPLETLHAELVSLIESTGLARLRDSRRLLKSLPEWLRIKLAFPPERWNTDPDLLPCRNGVLHLAAREITDHTAALGLMRTLGVAYDPVARAPAWEAFLKSTVPSTAEFLQEFAGLCLTFDTRYETAVWLYGPPGSGKSTFLRGLEVMLAERAGVLDLPTLSRGRLSPAGLFGRSLLISVEQPVADLKHDHLLNALVSGEPIPIERSRLAPATAPATLRLSAKWIWALTTLPRLGYAGSGLFRRARVVTFPPRLEADRDPALKARLGQEGPGILNWALAGLARLNQRGRFAPPPAVLDADERFRRANDLIAQFIADQTQADPVARVQASSLFGAYQAWCHGNGCHPQSNNNIAAELERLGFERRRNDGRTFWLGLQLKSPDTSPATSASESNTTTQPGN